MLGLGFCRLFPRALCAARSIGASLHQKRFEAPQKRLLSSASPSQPVYRADYRPPAYEIPTVSLSFDLYDDHTVVVSEFTLERLPWLASDAVCLDGDPTVVLVSLSANGVSLDGKYSLLESGRLLSIPVSSLFNGDSDSVTLRVVTRVEPQNNTQLSGL